MTRRGPWWAGLGWLLSLTGNAVVLPAAVGLSTMIITVLVTPRGDMMFDGYDSTGRRR